MKERKKNISGDVAICAAGSSISPLPLFLTYNKIYILFRSLAIKEGGFIPSSELNLRLQTS